MDRPRLRAHPKFFRSAAPFGGFRQYERHSFEHNGHEGPPSNYLFAPKFNICDLARPFAARRERKPKLMFAVGPEDRIYQPNLHWMAFLDSLPVQYEKTIFPRVKHDLRGVYNFLGSKSMEFQAAFFAARPNVAK